MNLIQGTRLIYKDQIFISLGPVVQSSKIIGYDVRHEDNQSKDYVHLSIETLSDGFLIPSEEKIEIKNQLFVILGVKYVGFKPFEYLIKDCKTEKIKYYAKSRIDKAHIKWKS